MFKSLQVKITLSLTYYMLMGSIRTKITHLTTAAKHQKDGKSINCIKK